MSSSAKTIAISVGAAAGGAYLFYRSIPFLMTTVSKLQMNPLDPELGEVIPEKVAPSYEEIRALGVIEGKSALVVGGTRGVGYGTALALAQSGASIVTVVGRSRASGSRAVSRILDELPSSSSTKVNFLQGDIGTVTSTNDLLEKLQTGDTRYDYLVVTAAIFPQPRKRNPSPLNDDGVEKSFGIGVVGRFLLYRKAHLFMKSPNNYTQQGGSAHCSPMILNVCASGSEMGIGFDRKLVRCLAGFNMFNIVNFGIGNELMLHMLVQNDNSDGTPFSIPVITTHPGFLKTDLHRGQGLLMDVAEAVMIHFMGCTEEECGRREVSLLCAIGNKRRRIKNSSSSLSLLTIVDNFGYGRLMNGRTETDLKDHGDWLWEMLVLMERGGSLDKYDD
jgi:NAD(P)-dependent dehydrogenase (short-subunit alcohol dehydrogenase family)